MRGQAASGQVNEVVWFILKVVIAEKDKDWGLAARSIPQGL
jgi:hypothetical protein